jgi:glycosyltransferase involved in cell wall biosynthesis
LRDKIAVYTVVTQNFFHFAKTLAESIVEQKWPVDIFVFVVDGDRGSSDLCSDIFTTLSLDDLFPRRPVIRLFMYTAFEMVVSVKPMAMQHLLRKGYEKVIFLDADILILGSIDPITSRLDHTDIMITPHITEPVQDTYHPGDLDFIKSGTLNSGFFAARNSDSTSTFLEWWQSKLATQCLYAPNEGLHYEQKWCDLIPSLFPQVYIDRSPGLNVAYWNLAQRDLKKVGDSYYVGDAPLIFFHFSGVVPEDTSILSRYDGRCTLTGDGGPLSTLLNDYVGRLRRNGLATYQHRQYRYNFFSDKITFIPPIVRKMYREHESIQEVFGDDPFDFSRDPGFRFTYNKKILTGRPALTWLAYEIYQGSKELMARFPHVPGIDSRNYVEWLTSVMPEQYRLPKAFLGPLVSGLSDGPSSVWEPILRGLKKGLTSARFGLDKTNPEYLDRQTKDALNNDRSGLDKTIPAYPHQESSTSLGRWGKGLRRRMFGTLSLVASKMKMVPGVKWAGRVALSFIQSRQVVVFKRTEKRHVGQASWPPCLNVVGLLKAQTGLGESARSTIRCATEAGLQVAPVDLNIHCEANLEENIPPHVAPVPNMPRPINIINVNGNLFPAVMLDLGERFFLGRYNIAFWVWEMRYFPPSWEPWLVSLNEIWTPSTFSQEALSRGADVPVVKIPHGVNPHAPSDILRSDLGLPEEGFIFLYSMDFHSVSERKNPEGVVQAFSLAFGQETSNIYLCLKLTSGLHRPDVMKRLYESVQSCDRIIMMQRSLGRPAMNALINLCDCYISLHRSEGFGLPLAEAMALGKPVIATGWSGNMDFMNVGNSFPVRFNLAELEKDVGPFAKGHSWAEPDVDHAAQLMRDVAMDRDLGAHVGRKAKDYMQKEFSPQRVGQLIRDRVRRLTAM